MATPVVFATNYGFLPKSIGLDNDPLDVMVISSLKIPPLTIVNVRILGVMRMIDTGEVDDKLIGVPEKDPVYTSYKEITDIPSQTINKIKAFFETYKILDNKIIDHIPHCACFLESHLEHNSLRACFIFMIR